MWIDLLTTYVNSKYMETIIQYSLYFAQRNTTGVLFGSQNKQRTPIPARN